MSNKTTTTTLTCPECGKELTISATSNSVNKDAEHITSSTVKFVKQAAPRGNGAERIAKLKAAGVDVTGFFAMGDSVMKIGADFSPICLDDDPVVLNIIADGSVQNRYLHDRFTLSHFINLGIRNERGAYVRDRNNKVYISRVRTHIEELGYDYSWRVVEMKLKRLAACQHKNDTEGTTQTGRWYNKKLVLDMFDDYMTKFEECISKMNVHKCKGEKYIELRAKRIGFNTDKGVFLKEIQTLKTLLQYCRVDIDRCTNNVDLYKAVKAWNKKRIALGRDIKKSERFVLRPCEAWVNAYEGYGAFFSMLNLIRFHGCRIHVREYSVYDKVVKVLDQFESEDMLNHWAELYQDESWWLTGAFKHLVDDNNIDVELKKKEWREAKLAKLSVPF